MKKILIAFALILALIFSLIGCSEETPDYRQELLDLGFADPQSYESSFLDTESVIWEVKTDESSSSVMTLIRATDGSWFFDDNWLLNVSSSQAWCAKYRVALEFSGWINNPDRPTFRVLVNNPKHPSFRDWTKISDAGWGKAYYSITKAGPGEWVPTGTSMERAKGYIPDISLQKLKDEAEAFFLEEVKDPFGQESSSSYRAYPYELVWDFEKGGLRE